MAMTRRKLLLALLALGISSSGARAATCTGANPCRACKNCSSCKRCAKDGKTCGVCKREMERTARS